VPTAALIDRIQELNARREITGILVQLPLPQQDADKIVAAIDPKKDADGFHPENLRLLREGRPGIISAAALGIRRLIEEAKIDLNGKQAVLVCRPRFAEPISRLLQDKNLHVQVVAPEAPDLARQTAAADVLIVAAGKAHFIKANMVKPGAIVIDVGTNKKSGRTVGDVAPEVKKTAGFMTPVPGGVGPMTVAMLLQNIVTAAQTR